MNFLAPLLMMGGGALAGSLGKKSSTWSGEKSKIHKLGTMNSQQKHLFKELFKHPERYLQFAEANPTYQQGAGYLQKILSQDPEMMKQFEAPAIRQFNEEIVPSIAERFAGMGGLSSGAFNRTMGQAGAGLAERIAAMRAQLGLGAAGQALNYAQMPFSQNMSSLGLLLGTPTFGYQATGGTPGVGSGLSTGLANAGAYGLGMYAAGQGGTATPETSRPVYPTSAGPTPWGGVPYAPGYVR